MSLRVVGVDPGLTRCGLAVVDVAANRQVSLVDVTVAGTPPGTPLDARLLKIANAIDEHLRAIDRLCRFGIDGGFGKKHPVKEY